VLIGGLIFCMAVPQALMAGFPAAVSPEFWWDVIPLAILAVVFYRLSLKATSSHFTARRERLLAVVEGRS
jgi:hypothetical protein